MIRKAQITDIPRMITLLNQVLEIHAKIRPDIFVSGKTKYTVEQLEDILKDETRPVYIFADDNDECMGYCFCQIKDIPKAEFMAPIKILFIDDLCVDESKRGEHIGRKLFDHIKEEAKKLGCYEVTLNDSAIAFYKNMNMKVKEYQMELIL